MNRSIASFPLRIAAAMGVGPALSSLAASGESAAVIVKLSFARPQLMALTAFYLSRQQR
jgi:hypothetical protein